MKYVSALALGFLLIGCSTEPQGAISASGTIEATKVTITAKVGGEVMTLLADEGTIVKKGDTLAVIDRSDLEIQLKQAVANADAADAQYQLSVKGAREEDILQAEANYTSAQQDLNRADELFKAKSITKKQLEDMQTRFVVTQQSYEKLKRGSRPEEIRAARARRDQAVAQVEATRKKISETFVVASMGGVVTEKGLEQGDVVMPNGSVFRISRLDKVHLMIYVSEEELARVKLGQPADVYIDAYPNKAFPGTVAYISDIAEFTPKNVQTKDDRTKLVFRVKIEVTNADGSLKPGMPADATIRTSTGS
jgi:HlyD family secretion protein